jgi:Fe-S cluster biosynthesis and repair protein YggX
MGAQKKGGLDTSLLPNEISEDHWAEINNHQYQLYLEDEERLKNEKLKKRNLIRETLQQQLEQ